MNIEPPPTNSEVADALASTLGWGVSSVERFEEGLNAVYRVELLHRPPCVLKAATMSGDHLLLTEAALLSWLGAETDVPFPDIHATIEPAESALGTAAYVMEYYEGRGVTDMRELPRDDQQCLLRESARHLADTHEVSLGDGFGPLRLVDERVTIDTEHESWGAMFQALFQEALEDLGVHEPAAETNPEFSGVLPALRHTYTSRLQDLEWTATPAIQFEDYRLANLIVAPDGAAPPLVRAVLDVGSSPTVDALLDCALAEDALIDIPFWDTQTADPYRTVFRREYAANRTSDHLSFGSERYELYRLYARVLRMGQFGYWSQFDAETDRALVAQRWTTFLEERFSSLDS